MRVVALLTGRGNNTLNDKNILDVLGKPVLYYPAHAARMAEGIDSYYCSSDDENILKAAELEGYRRILRPFELSMPFSQHVDVIMHALKEIETVEGLPDILIVLLANNVTVKSEWIEKCINMLKNDLSISAVVPIYEDNDHHPLRGKKIKENRLEMYEDNVSGNISTNRQDLPPCYFLAHNFWVLNVKKMIESKCEGQPPWNFMGNNIAYIEIDESIDIHKKIDLLIAEYWIKDNYKD